MRQEQVTLDPNSLDPSYDFVFRDFERSRIDQIRGILAQDRGLFSLVYLGTVIFWTTMMSVGSIAYGNGNFAVNLSPHVAHYTLIIGVMLYPLRRMWIPLAAFSAVYFIPFVLPNPDNPSWLALTRDHPSFVMAGFLAHVMTGVLIGASSMLIARKLNQISGPHTVDLLTVLTLFFAFLVFCGLQVWVIWSVAQTLPEVARLDLGFGADYLHAATERVLRGGVVASGFLLGVLEAPRRRALLQGMVLSVVFVAMAWGQNHGVTLYPTLDVCLLALLITTILPASVGISACIVGIPIYSAMTGTFVSTAHLHDPAADMLEHFALILLAVIALIPTLRAHSQYILRQREASMRRLSMVRDFANVGLLSFNLDRNRFRMDASAQRILATSASGGTDDFAALFQGQDQADIHGALRDLRGDSFNLMLTRQTADQPAQMLRMCLWYETAPSGEKAAYGLVLDVTAEHRQERALEDTLAELSSRQERQRQLFSIISHELRTPASVVAMLVEDMDSQRVTAKLRKQLREATDQLLSTLADMRQTVNPSQNLPITRLPYSAADLADSVRNMFEPQAREHGMTIRLSLCDSARHLRLGDQMRMRQAISNVVRNAIIHSKGSQVIVRFETLRRAGRDYSRWTITDDGVGIPADQVERLFKAFERGVQDPRSHADGSGLGLFIAKSAVEMLGGSVEHFAPDGGGTGYRIELPEALVQNDQSRPAATPKPDQAAVFPDVYIILAEDNALVAEVTLAKLARFVGRVEVAGNGREALQMIRDQRPDLLITDLFMPEMDGDELIRVLRGQGHDFPIIGLTAAVVGDDIERLRLAGATNVMAKPLDTQAIRKVVQDLAHSTPAPRPRRKRVA